MFIEIDELKSVAYRYQVQQITENDDTIVVMAIQSSIDEAKSYLNPSAQLRFKDGRLLYDTGAIFSATGDDRNPLILEFCKDIAIYRLCRLTNIDLIMSHVQDRYDRAIDWLSKVAGVGKYKDAPTLNPDLPILQPDPLTSTEPTIKAFRCGSRPKFNHE